MLRSYIVPGLTGNKMSASDPDSKIDMLDSADVVKSKLKKVHTNVMACSVSVVIDTFVCVVIL